MSRHHRAAGWSKISPKARARLQPMLPLPCAEGCGYPVLPGQAWDVAHVGGDLALGGDLGAYAPAHRKCNRSKGGKLGAAIQQAQRAGVVRRSDPRQVKW